MYDKCAFSINEKFTPFSIHDNYKHKTKDATYSVSRFGFAEIKPTLVLLQKMYVEQR